MINNQEYLNLYLLIERKFTNIYDRNNLLIVFVFLKNYLSLINFY